MSHRSFRTALSMGALAALSCSVYGPSDLTGSGSGGAPSGGQGGAGESGATGGGRGGQNAGGSELGGAGMATTGGTSGTGPKGGAGGNAGDPGEGGAASGAGSGGTEPTGGRSGGGGGGGASGGSGGANTGGAPTSGGGGPVLPPELIDDMEDGNLYVRYNEERTGLWYTAADTANKSSAKGGMIAVTGSPVTGSTMAYHFVGDGSFGWGAQAAFDFLYVGTAKKEPYDASKYKGIHFYAKAAAATTVLVRIPIVATTENATGSTCIPSSKSSTPTCEDHYTAEVALTTSFALISLDWSGTTPRDFHQQGWGKATWDPSQLLSVQFAVDSACEFWIDDISFNK